MRIQGKQYLPNDVLELDRFGTNGDSISIENPKIGKQNQLLLENSNLLFSSFMHLIAFGTC